jgi:hypothetical protein
VVKSPGHTAEIGFTIALPFQRRGYGGEACRAAIDLLFRLSAIQTIEAVIDVRNTSAIALIERLGMSSTARKKRSSRTRSVRNIIFVSCRRDKGEVDIDNNDREIDNKCPNFETLVVEIDNHDRNIDSKCLKLATLDVDIDNRDRDIDNESLKLATFVIDIANYPSDFE